MKKLWWKRAVWVVVAIALVALLVRAFRDTPVPVDVATVARDTLRITVDDDGRTRVRERYTITAPIQGRLLRTTLDPGDAVRANETIVAEFAPIAPSLLDARSRAEAVARLARAEVAVKEIEARNDQVAADLDLAVAELERVRKLAQSSVLSTADLDAAERNERSAREGRRAAQFAVEVARFELQLARASLGEPVAGEISDQPSRPEHDEGSEDPARRLRLRSPIDGRVLHVHEESARSLPAGSPLIEVGNTALLEVVADYLTQDAVKVRPGMIALVEGWGGEGSDGGEQVLRGRVRVVEPGGFTKISALGVEEQRVNVVVDPVGDLQQWAALGDGFRVELRILLFEADDLLLAPMGALFRDGDSWAAFVVTDGVAQERILKLGRRSALEAQVLAGLDVGDEVVLYPSQLLRHGAAVEPR